MLDFIRVNKFNLFIYAAFFQKITARNIYRNRNKRILLLFPYKHILANLFNYKHIELGNKTIFFKKRNKLSRRHKAIFRMFPADKSFGTNNFSCNSFVLWLVVNFKLTIFQSIFHCFVYALFIKKMLLKICFKEGNVFSVDSLYLLNGKEGSVTTNNKRNFMTYRTVNTNLYNLMRNRCSIKNCLTQIFNAFNINVIAFEIEKQNKLVSTITAGNTFWNKTLQAFCCICKEFITFLFAI